MTRNITNAMGATPTIVEIVNAIRRAEDLGPAPPRTWEVTQEQYYRLLVEAKTLGCYRDFRYIGGPTILYGVEIRIKK